MILYLFKSDYLTMDSYYLSNTDKYCPGEPTYFRKDSKELHVFMPTWFQTKEEAILEAEKMGFKVVES